MANHHTKSEDTWAISSLVIDRTRFVYGPTDRPTDGPTFAKQYTPPLFFKGGHNKIPHMETTDEVQKIPV